MLLADDGAHPNQRETPMRNPRDPESDCPSCGASGSVNDEICVACRDAFRWVVKPEAHRENRRRQIARFIAYRDGGEPDHPLSGSFPANNGTWNCDLCDTQIDVPAEFTLIPLSAHVPCVPAARSDPRLGLKAGPIPDQEHVDAEPARHPSQSP